MLELYGRLLPMSSQPDHALIEELAPTFDLEAQEAAAVLRRPAPIRYGEWVGAAAKHLLPIADEYACLTGRRAALVDDPVTAAEDPSFSVLVTETNRITPELLEGMFADKALQGRLSTPGLVFAGTGSNAHRRALQHAVAMRLNAASEPGRRLALFPLDNVGPIREGDGSIVAGAGRFEEVADALRGGSIALLSIATHSDGIDMFLGPGQVACGWNSWNHLAIAGAIPRCRKQGHCHRLDLPFGEEELRNRLIDPVQWRARVLFLDICFGLMATDLINRRYGLVDALVGGGRMGAIVTNFELSFTSVRFSETVSEALCSGIPIGKALRNLTCSPAARGLNRRFALIGDPALTCPVAVQRLLPSSGGDTRHAPSTHPEFGALRCCLHVAGETELAQAPPSLERDDAIIAWLCRRGKIFDLWSRLSHISYQGAQFDCPLCGRRGKTFQSGSEAPHLKRELLLCIACGVIADRPAKDATLMGPPELGQFRLVGHPKRPVRRAVLQLWGGDVGCSAHSNWPISKSGVPEAEYTWSKPWPIGPLRASIFLFHGDELSIASSMISGPKALHSPDGQMPVSP